MPSPQELSNLRKNVLGSFEDFSRLRSLGSMAEQFPEVQRTGFSLEDKGAVFLNAMLNEFFSVSSDENVYRTALLKTNAFVDRENRMGGHSWGLVREHLLEIGWQRGWSTPDTLWDDWTPAQQKSFSSMIESETRKSGRCYVATAVYGSYDCPEVWVLRRFRDQTLMGTVLGRAAVRVYYATSPLAVRFGGSALRRLTRRPLARLVRALRAQGISDAPYADFPVSRQRWQ